MEKGRFRGIPIVCAILFSFLVCFFSILTPAYADMDGNGMDEVIVDFGATYGTFVYYNDSTWSKLHSLSPELIATGDLDGNGLDDLIVDFGATYGTFVYYNNSTWVKLHSLSPEFIAAGDLDGNGQDDAILDFGPTYGTFVYYNNSTWSKLHSLSPDLIATGDLDGNGLDEVIVDFGATYGTFVYYNNSAWSKLHSLSPELIATGDLDGIGGDEVVMGFAGYGTFVYNNGSWSKLHSLSPELIATGDLDGNGLDEVVMGFAGYGTFVYNNSTWSKLHSLSPEIIATGDMDGNGKDDLIVDFGATYGIFVYYNNSTWSKLHSLSPEFMATGDGSGGDIKDSAAFVTQMVNLANQASQGQVSNEEFLTQYYNILSAIDSTPNGPQSFETYLENEVLGYSITYTSAVESSASSVADIIDGIKNSTAYQTVKAFLESVLWSLTPGGTVLQAAQPELAITIALLKVRTDILNAQFSGQIDIIKAQELLVIVGTNPFEAKRQLLTALGEPIPSWLQPAPSICLRDCTPPLTGTWTGSFSGSGNFANTNDDCVFSVGLSGNMSITMAVGSGNSVSGTGQITSGTWNSTPIGGTNCISSNGSISGSGSLSGTTSSISWSSTSGFPNISFSGQLNGSGTQITGTGTFTFPNTTGSAPLSITLNKQ